MGQEKRSNDEVRGRYLAKWVEDLRAGRSPEVDHEALSDLTESEIQDLLAMARFTKAVNFPTDPGDGHSNTIRSNLSKLVLDMRKKQLESGHSLVVSSGSFGDCLRIARSNLGVSVDDLSNDTGIPKQLLADVEAGKRSPIRIEPLEKMMALILRLSITFRETAELIRTSAEKWTFENFQTSPTQLGRTRRDLPLGERCRLMEGGGSQDVASAVQRELVRIKQYTDALHQQIEKESPRFG